MREGRLLEGGGLPGGKQDRIGNQGVGLDHAGGTDRPLLPGLRAHHTWQPRGCAGWGAHTSFRVTTARKLRRGWASLLVRRQTMPQVNSPPPPRFVSSFPELLGFSVHGRERNGLAWSQWLEVEGEAVTEKRVLLGFQSSGLSALTSLGHYSWNSPPLLAAHPPSTNGPAPGPRVKGVSQGHPQIQKDQALQGRDWWTQGASPRQGDGKDPVSSVSV